MAGTRQAEMFLAVMENYDKAMEYAKIATESDGQAMEKMAIYTDNLEAKMNELKAAWESFIYNEDVVDLFKDFLDVTTQLIKALTMLIENPMGRLVVKTAAVTASITGLITVFQAFKKASNLSKNLLELGKMLGFVGKQANVASVGIGALMGKLFLVVAAIEAVVWILDKLIITEKEQKEILQDAIQEYKQHADAVNSLNDKLNENKEKLQELQEVPQSNRQDEYWEDVEALKEENEQLQIKLDIEKRLADQSRIKKAEEAKKTFEKTHGNEEAIEWDYQDRKQQIQGLKEEIKEYEAQNADHSLDWMIGDMYDSLSELQSETDEWVLSLINSSELLDENDVSSKKIIDSVNVISENWNSLNKVIDTSNYSTLKGNELLEDRLKTQEQLRDQETEWTGGIQKFESVLSGLEAVKNLTNEINSQNTISLKQLKSIVAIYPELEAAAQQYLMGTIQEKDFLELLSQTYDLDLKNYVRLLNAKMQYSTDFYNKMGFADAEFVNKMSENYDVDLSNAKTLAEAKAKIEFELLSKLGSWWSDYYDAAQGQLMDKNILYNNPNLTAEQMNQYLQVETAVNKARDAWKRFDEITLDSATTQFEKLGSSLDSVQKSADKAKKAYDDLLKMVVNMLKQEKENEKSALKDQLDNYKKIIDARKKMLDQLKEERDYKKDIEKKNKGIADLENRLAELQNDTQREAAAQRAQIEEELQNKKTELEDDQYQHSVDSQKDALDKEYGDFEQDIKQRIKAIDEYLKHTGEITKEAMDLINEHANSTYQRLSEWNRVYGDGIQQTIENAWWGAKNALDAYNSSLAQTQHIQGNKVTTPDKPDKESTQTESIRPKTNSPYKLYSGTGKKVGETNDYTRAMYQRNQNGGYFVNSKGQINTMHGGIDSGFVGNSGGNEEFIKALKGEAFVTRYQQDRFMNESLPKMVSNLGSIAGNFEVGNLMQINVQGNLDEKVVPKIKEIAQDTIKQLNNGMFRRGYNRNTNAVSI